MEQEFYRDEFEQLLKDTTDDFKMYPSRKVWHSIYNDLHPDRKWPSFAVCLLLLTIILYVGVTNNNAISHENKKNAPALALNNTESTADSKSQQPPGSTVPGADLNPVNISPAFPLLTVAENIEVTRYTPGSNKIEIINTDETSVDGSSSISVTALTNSQRTRSSITAADAVRDEEANNPTNKLSEEELSEMSPAGAAELAGKTVPSKALVNLAAAGKNMINDNREREWIEDFAFHNKKNSAAKSLRGLSTQFYVTPSVGYRVMFKNREDKTVGNTLVAGSAARNAEETELVQQAAMNMEAGVGIIKDLGKKLRFKTGLQFNYTDYLTYAQKLDHSTQTSLAVGNQGSVTTLEPYSADYAHIPGNNNSKLHNKTIQLSIPVGLDYKILSNRVLNWYVGASVQPTLVTRANSYLLSSDNNYFVEDQAMIRRVNLNGALESFVSIKTKSGTFINLGPQFRYQLFSTYSKSYLFTEKPYNVGFKIGFTRPL